MKLLGSYPNGNYTVSIFEDGTKIRENNLDFFESKFPECIDLKITDYCDAGCLFCHENSTKQGLHGDITAKFVDTLNPFTELAIGGGNPLDHPELVYFLRKLKEKNIIANLTVNQIHFEKHFEFIRSLKREGLIWGLGVSLIKATDKFLDLISDFPDTIIHVINGVITQENLQKMYDKNLKILILGYKNIRRGKDYYSSKVEDNKKVLHNNLEQVREHFCSVSFDNLSLEQLEVKRLLSDKEWDDFYMGSDGQFTMYVDLVKEEFSMSSTCPTRFGIMDNIEDMFHIVKSMQVIHG
jgi:organic radical activating enzyme